MTAVIYALICKLRGHDVTLYESRFPNGDLMAKFECDRCGEVIHGAMVAEVPEP